MLQSQYLKMLGWNAVASASSLSWSTVAGIVVGSTLLALLAGVAAHKWRLRRTMQSEVHEIMYAPIAELPTIALKPALYMPMFYTVPQSRPRNQKILSPLMLDLGLCVCEKGVAVSG